MIEGARRILKTVFGYDRFISLQEEVIATVLGGRDCLAVMPTGGGKSLCYQIPALMWDGLTVVVSPLIALMKDQVDALTQLDVPAVMLNSTLSPDQYRHVVSRVRGGGAKLLYVAPETLLRPPVLTLLDSVPVSCLAIDEAHCISEWGHDFRPEYRQIAEFRARIPRAVCLALTATATPRVRTDIKASLGFDDSSEFVASFNRDNLLIRVIPKDKPLNQAIELLRKYPNDPGIIYCSTRRQVDVLCEALADQGFSVCPYHAGLSDQERARSQDRFVRDEVNVIVATVAFGMGIDKSNVRFVLHYDLPKNIEGYYQEIGRAGRDGLQAECVLLFSYGDLHKVKYFIAQKEGLEQRAASLQLSLLLKFAESEVCRRIPLLAYFGETFPHERCGLCDNCLAGDREMKDITIPAQKFLSCVKRTGERFGITHVIEVLRGSKADKVLRFGHDTVSTYGIGRELSRRQWQQIARQLLHKGLMTQDADVGGLSLTPKAWEVFRGSEAVFGRLDDTEEPPKPPDKPAARGELAYDPDLFETLRKTRKELADAANVPPYVIFSDKSLAEMAAYLPRSPDALLSIHGVGRAKLDRFGSVFIDVIEAYCRAHPVESQPSAVVARAPEKRGPVRKMREIAVGKAFDAGQSIESLARIHGVRESRILDYLLSYLQEGKPLQAERFLPYIAQSGGELERVMKTFEAEGPDMLRPVFDALGGEVSYDDLRVLRLYFLSLHGTAGGKEGPLPESWPQRCKLICLANSRKFSGRCIAGKVLTDDLVGPWVRPISTVPTGELTQDRITLNNGAMPRLLDILSVPLLGPAAHTYQSENHTIGEGGWSSRGRWPLSGLDDLIDPVDRIWLNGYHSQNGLNDRMPEKAVTEALSSSLLFVRASDLAFTVQRDTKGLNRVRARFTFNGEEYWMPVTDPEVEAVYLPRESGRYPVDCRRPYVTISISEPYAGSCYKLAAAFILPPEEEPST